MQTIPDKEFDKLFQNKLDSFEPDPSPAIWGKIVQQLEDKKKSFFTKWIAAASIAIIFATGLWLLPKNEPIKLQGKVKPQELPKPEVQDNMPLAIEPVRSKTPRLAEVRLKGKVLPLRKSKVSVISPEARISVQKEEVQNNATTVLAEVRRPVVQVEPMQPQWRTNTRTSISEPVLALHAEVSLSDDSLKSKAKIKTVGDLVNFVVSKVDKRKNKIIEFSKEDDGEVISGFNLGVVQYQTQNK